MRIQPAKAAAAAMQILETCSIRGSDVPMYVAAYALMEGIANGSIEINVKGNKDEKTDSDVRPFPTPDGV